MKKVLNVFGIIFAWILSITLVLMLFVTPMLLSTLSMLSVDTITQVVSQSFVPSAEEKPANNGAVMVTLSDTTGGNANVSGSMSDMLQQAGLSEDMVNKILSSQAAKDLINTYMEDVTNAITGNGDEVQFNAERVKQIVNDNIDEIVGILQDVSPEYANMDAEEIKGKLMDIIDQNVDQIVEALPKPEEIITEIQNGDPVWEGMLQIVAYKDTIKLTIVGAVALVAALIFALRLPGFRGVRWLATDLFVGSGFNVLLCGGLLASGSVIGEMVAQEPAIAGAVNALMSSFTTGMLVRTGIMLVCAVGLLVAYIFIKKALARKQAADLIVEQTLEAEAAPQE